VRRVFVYGTLRAGEKNHPVLGASRCLGEARTAPIYSLWDVGNYPALVPGGTTAVCGEIYEVDADALARLDVLEGHPTLFRREAIALEDGTIDGYVFVAPLVGASEIASGDWMARVPPPTARLRFRSWRGDDLALASALWGDPRVTRWIDARERLDEAAVREKLEKELRLRREHGVQIWPIFEGEAGAHVGGCGLRVRDAVAGVYELGFHLVPSAWGKGYATEASRAVIAFAFERLAASALFAGHHPENAASRRALVKLGFVHTHDEPYGPTGALHPSYRLERHSGAQPE
jgi:RimJ/RimL family protein N-acetyltransferase/gamma-glutamylcyclotransferase (GGCT)/AIG2-like uncharacterized protein YtfP